MPHRRDEQGEVYRTFNGKPNYVEDHVNMLVLLQQVLGDEAPFLADALFRVFDDDGSGSMDFQEYILALNATKYVEESGQIFSQ